jgi:hypothetical protein
LLTQASFTFAQLLVNKINDQHEQPVALAQFLVGATAKSPINIAQNRRVGPASHPPRAKHQKEKIFEVRGPVGLASLHIGGTNTGKSHQIHSNLTKSTDSHFTTRKTKIRTNDGCEIAFPKGKG